MRQGMAWYLCALLAWVLPACDGAELSLGDDDTVGDDDAVWDDDDGADDDAVDDDDTSGADDDDTAGDDDDSVAPCGTLTVTPSSVTFGATQVGQTSSATLTLENTGADPLEITAIAASVAEFGYQGLAPPLSIAAGDSVTVTVSFTPTAGATVTGSLDIETCDGTATVPLEGEGQDCDPCQPDIVVSPLLIDFGALGGGTGTGNFTVSNAGDVPLQLTSATGTASAAGGIVTLTAGDATALLDPADVEAFTVEWTPGELFAGQGCLDALDGTAHFITIASDDPDEPTVLISLQGCCDAVTGGNLCNYADPSGLLTCMGTAPCADPFSSLMYCALGLPC